MCVGVLCLSRCIEPFNVVLVNFNHFKNINFVVVADVEKYCMNTVR